MAVRVQMVLFWLLCTLLSACRTCGDHVAELEQLEGTVERDEDASRGAFREAERGDRFWLGDGLRTGKDGRARLILTPEGVAVVEPDTLLRFLADHQGKAPERIALEEGTLHIERAPFDLEVHTPRAIARLPRHGKMHVTTTAQGEERFDVLVGRVSIDYGGVSQKLAAGESFTVPAKAAASAPSTPYAPATSAETEIDSAPTEAPPLQIATTDAPLLAGGPADLEVQDERAVVHSPNVPVRVAFPLPPCDGPAKVDLSSGGRAASLIVHGEPWVTGSLGAGTHRLRVRCGNEPARELTVRVQRDLGTEELPKTAPHVDVEADGRKYTVHYQNVLPGVSFVWPRAAEAGRYTLVLERRGRTTRHGSEAPAWEAQPGELAEGDYRFWFEGEGGARSPESSLRIVFDNTARSAYVSEPRPGQVVSDARVLVAGGALARSEVSVGDHRLELDAQGRFRGEVPVPEGQDSIAVRVQHPLAGVHYYLRRIR